MRLRSGDQTVMVGLGSWRRGAASWNTICPRRCRSRSWTYRSWATQWARIRGRLQSEVGEVEYRNWLRQMTLAGVDGDEITLHLPTRFLSDWVRSHYGERLNALWHAENPAIRRVDIRVGGMAPPIGGIGREPRRGRRAAAAGAVPDRGAGGPGATRAELALDPRFTFDAFVVGKPNEFAYACARRVAERPSSHGFNPLFLYGGVGLGKTHLMHAIAWELVARNGANGGRPVSVAYMSAEKFMYRFIAAIRSQQTMQFKEQLRSRRRADDRRPAVPHRQGQHAGGILPHLQRAGGCRQADRGVGRQVAVRPVGARRPAAHQARLRHGRRPARHHVRAAHLHPGGQGGARRRGGAAPR